MLLFARVDEHVCIECVLCHELRVALVTCVTSNCTTFRLTMQSIWKRKKNNLVYVSIRWSYIGFNSTWVDFSAEIVHHSLRIRRILDLFLHEGHWCAAKTPLPMSTFHCKSNIWISANKFSPLVTTIESLFWINYSLCERLLCVWNALRLWWMVHCIRSTQIHREAYAVAHASSIQYDTWTTGYKSKNENIRKTLNGRFKLNKKMQLKIH